MDRVSNKIRVGHLRKQRVRSVITGTRVRPRLSVHVGNSHIVAQIVDDESHKTLVYSSTAGNRTVKGTMTDQARWVGSDLAGKAKAVKVKRVVFDRGARLYHGRIKALAEAARAGGLEF
jgi:large subunit ribosomal protein L18